MRIFVAGATGVIGRRVVPLLKDADTPDSGTVRVGVEAKDDACIAISVVDTGTGIPSDQLALIWERFHRVDPSRSRRTGGMGLGLAVVRHLAAGMGGEVRAESEMGRGSRFTVVLPRAAGSSSGGSGPRVTS